MTDFEAGIVGGLAKIGSEVTSLREELRLLRDGLPCKSMQERVRQLELNGARGKGILAGMLIASGAVGGGVSQLIRALLGV